MIVRTLYATRKDGVNLFVSYSDAGYKIQQEQTGAVYDVAIDVEGASYTYIETDEIVEEPVDPTPPDPVEEQLSDTEALNIIMGEE